MPKCESCKYNLYDSRECMVYPDGKIEDCKYYVWNGQGNQPKPELEEVIRQSFKDMEVFITEWEINKIAKAIRESGWKPEGEIDG